MESWTLTDFDPTLEHEKICAAKCLTFRLTYVRVAWATADVHIILEVLATDKIHIEDQNMVLPELSQAMGYTTSKTVSWLACKQLHFNPLSPKGPPFDE